MNEGELAPLHKCIHDMNNRLGTILAAAEMLHLEQLSPKATDRVRLIEGKSLELRDLIKDLTKFYFG
jgi:hypothetical protein